jgi:hypothetical protein
MQVCLRRVSEFEFGGFGVVVGFEGHFRGVVRMVCVCVWEDWWE